MYDKSPQFVFQVPYFLGLPVDRRHRARERKEKQSNNSRSRKETFYIYLRVFKMTFGLFMFLNFSNLVIIGQLMADMTKLFKNIYLLVEVDEQG